MEHVEAAFGSFAIILLMALSGMRDHYFRTLHHSWTDRRTYCLFGCLVISDTRSYQLHYDMKTSAN